MFAFREVRRERHSGPFLFIRVDKEEILKGILNLDDLTWWTHNSLPMRLGEVTLEGRVGHFEFSGEVRKFSSSVG